MLNIVVVDPSTESAAENVAKKRAAARAAAQEYHQVKVQTLYELGKVLSATGGLHTARQLADVSGLSSGEIAAQFCGDGRCQAATEAGLRGHVRAEGRRIIRRFIEVDADGNPIDSRIIERKQNIIVYGARGVDGITCG